MTALAPETTSLILTPNTVLTSGITKVDSSLSIVTDYQELGPAGSNYRHSRLTTCALMKATAADAALAFGEWIASFPVGRVLSLGAYVKLTSTCPTGLSATAGEVGLGSTIASGANATLGAVGQAAENIMEGTTLANHVAAVTLTSNKANKPAAPSTSATDGQGVLDGSITGAKIHLNLASTFDQTAAESITFQAVIDMYWVWMGLGS